ncbi:MAG TPA: hypothetical protein VLW54_09665 [Candidatus Acidoferrales bacterium]|nr:hypothetical protein [Candidatus Acidoferrales bacterium]
MRIPFSILAGIALLAAAASAAQQRAGAERSDGRTTPLMVYSAAGGGTACPPLAVISHGAGGSETGYGYLATFLAQQGYTAVVMGHRESGLKALTQDMREDGFLGGLRALVGDRGAEEARLLDVGAALGWANARCAPPFRVLLGHSMGAETVMLEAGARNMVGVRTPPAGRGRFDAYVALSPEGPGVVFPDDAWKEIHKPLLVLTGTRDQSLKGGPEARQIPWKGLPGDPEHHCQWMGVIDGATHMNFAGNGMGASRVDGMVTATIARFLAGVRAGACKLPAPEIGMTLQAK